MTDFSSLPLFAAANNKKGFVSFYGDIFANSKIERRYIVKGGPGTGKSSFLQRVAAHAESGGYSVEYYRCSSDPSSLDGIIIDGRISVIDGTAPHSEDTSLAGARDELVDLGAFWNSHKLFQSRRFIEALSAEKREYYAQAYRFLSACGTYFDINSSMTDRMIKKEKLIASVHRSIKNIEELAGNIKNNGKGSALAGLRASVGMSGCVCLDSYERAALRLHVVDDFYKMGHLYLSAIINECIARGYSLRVSYNPIEISCPDAVCILNTGDCFVIGANDDIKAYSRINMKRFASADEIRTIREEWRSNERAYNSALSSACECLARAGDSHFKLEKIYIDAMDFDAQNKFCEAFLRKYSEFL